MNYHLSDPTELKACRNRITYLAKKQQMVKVTQIQPSRTLNQNNYLHLLLADFGIQFGYTLDEAKIIYKELNKNIYTYTKKQRTFTRSSASLNKDEMAQSIDQFIEKVKAQTGYTLPPATNQEWLLSIENKMEQQRKYLRR